ncbi:MAG: ribonucleoside-diphosphate reductase subunit alpha, partial [Burkholderiales bacterium]|nr:ribonucleoside-diphosphate reductase subunit alpha [Burkholderiales bacterium]
DLYATAFEVDPNWLVECASRRQKWIDQGQSLNLYLAGASGKKLDELYKFAWLRGLKTTYYLRTMAATAAEKSTGSGGELNAVAVDGVYTQTSAAGANSISSAPTMAAIDAELPATDMKFCSIDNPECESCQ